MLDRLTGDTILETIRDLKETDEGFDRLKLQVVEKNDPELFKLLDGLLASAIETKNHGLFFYLVGMIDMYHLQLKQASINEIEL